jgi:hypothetical protein
MNWVEGNEILMMTLYSNLKEKGKKKKRGYEIMDEE